SWEVVARRLAQHPAGHPLSRERSIDAAQRLDADEVAEREDVERDLEPQLAMDLSRRVRSGTRFVVLHDAPRAERVDIDPIDLPRQPETVGQGEPALELGSSPFRPEPDLEPARDERDLGGGLVADEPLEVGEESLAELRR